MLKKTIPYRDVNDNLVEDTFFFNLNKAEIAKMALEKEGSAGGFEQWIQTMVESREGAVLTEAFEKLLLATVGQPSDDGKKFVKNDQIRSDFFNSDAYSELFMEIITDMDKMSAFVNGVMPLAMREEAVKEAQKVQTGPDISSVPAPAPAAVTAAVREEPKDDTPAWVREGRIPSPQELKNATPEQVTEAFRRRSENAGPVNMETVAE